MLALTAGGTLLDVTCPDPCVVVSGPLYNEDVARRIVEWYAAMAEHARLEREAKWRAADLADGGRV